MLKKLKKAEEKLEKIVERKQQILEEEQNVLDEIQGLQSQLLKQTLLEQNLNFEDVLELLKQTN